MHGRQLLALVFSIASFCAPSAVAATRTWSGAASALWSDPANWVEGVAPVAGDQIVVPSFSMRTTSTNDLPAGTTFDTLTVGADNQGTGAPAVTINGNRMQLTNGLSIGAGFDYQVFLPRVDPAAVQTWTGLGPTIAGTPKVHVETVIPAGITVFIGHLNATMALSGSGTLDQNERGTIELQLTPDFTGIAQTGVIFIGGLIVDGDSAPNATLRADGSGCAGDCVHGLTIRNSVLGTIESVRGKVDLTALTGQTQTSQAATLIMGPEAQFRASVSSTSLVPLVVTDTVTLGGASLRVFAAETLAAGTPKMLIDNQSALPVDGTFEGLAEGATMTAGVTGQKLIVSYTGGDGNDVVVFPVNDTPDDFDGDGRADILWRHAVTGENYLWLMNGFAAASQGFINTVPDLGWTVAGVGDFNGDDRSDVLWRNTNTGEVYLYLMNGMNILSQAPVGTVADLAWKIVAIGDFDGDGASDIFWRHDETSENYLWILTGPAAGRGFLDGVPDPLWKVAGTGDFNSDKKSDVIWRHEGTGEIYGWLMNGFTRISHKTVTTVPDLDLEIVGIADFDRSGGADILFRHAVTGENELLRMVSLYIDRFIPINTVPDVDWKVERVADYDGDLRADILWRHATTGDNYLYLMDGPSIMSSDALAAVPDTAWTIMP